MAREDGQTEESSAFCQRRRILDLSLFGWAVRDDFRADSDVDVPVVVAADAVQDSPGPG